MAYRCPHSSCPIEHALIYRYPHAPRLLRNLTFTTATEFATVVHGLDISEYVNYQRTQRSIESTDLNDTVTNQDPKLESQNKKPNVLTDKSITSVLLAGFGGNMANSGTYEVGRVICSRTARPSVSPFQNSRLSFVICFLFACKPQPTFHDSAKEELHDSYGFRFLHRKATSRCPTPSGTVLHYVQASMRNPSSSFSFVP